jgi:class 3 adenylate cyclase
MSLLTRLAVATLIAAVVMAAVLVARATPGVRVPLARLDDTMYDAAYRWRPVERERTLDVVIIAVDQKSLKLIDTAPGYQRGWPWPRQYWGNVLEYLLEECHPKAVAFDLLFSEHSVNPGGDDKKTDDALFGEAIDRGRANGSGGAVFGSLINADGSHEPFIPPVKTSVDLAAVNISDAERWRQYLPSRYGVPSLALEAVKSAGVTPKLPTDRPFLLHYYGPHQDRDGRHTFQYIAAGNVVLKSYGDSGNWHVGPELFRDKFVLIGGVAAGTYDEKSTPLSAKCPGVEIQATAIENLLHGDEVHQLGGGAVALVTFLVAWLTALGVELPRRAEVKTLLAVVVLVALLAVFARLFTRSNIVWLPVAAPLVAWILATIVTFAWSFLGEDRQRRRLLKALSSVVSPHVAEELARDPRKLSIGGQRREMTVMFTDIAGFTDLSETLPPERLAPMLNHYLEEMSAVVLGQSGTLDKYIGDAIMSFWNAPLPQPEHAVQACRAALRMVRREAEIQPELRALGAAKLMTRIGINTGPMAVGFTGSSRLMNYTVLGDAVNLASRLEGANKIYGTRVMLSEGTAEQVRDRFVLRKLDVLRVKGKLQPMAVYELIAEGPPDEATRRMVTLYESALRSYQDQQWADAERDLLELASFLPEDKAGAVLLGRIRQFRQSPPPAGWDGVYVAKEK